MSNATFDGIPGNLTQINSHTYSFACSRALSLPPIGLLVDHTRGRQANAVLSSKTMTSAVLLLQHPAQGWKPIGSE